MSLIGWILLRGAVAGLLTPWFYQASMKLKMQFINPRGNFPFSDAVLYSGRILEAVLTGIPPGQENPVQGGVQEELREIFRQLDAILAQVHATKRSIVSVRLYLADVNRDIACVNAVYKGYFESHPPNRRAYGVTLQRGMQIEAAFVAELPPLQDAA